MLGADDCAFAIAGHGRTDPAANRYGTGERLNALERHIAAPATVSLGPVPPPTTRFHAYLRLDAEVLTERPSASRAELLAR